MERHDMTRTESLILIIDDDATQRVLTRETLTQFGYAVEEAESGETGLALARDLRPDLVLLDVMMPGMSGFEACEAIRADADLHRTPVIIVTALEDHESIDRGFDVGANDFLTKPIVWPLLGYRVRFALRAAEMERDLRIARDYAEKSGRAKSALLANMGHELRTPLNAIIGFSGYLRDQAVTDGAPADQIGFLGDINDSGQKLLASINCILEMACLDSGRSEIEESEFAAERLLDEVAREHAVAAAGKTISVHHSAPPELDVVGDSDMLRRAIGNLVSNAVAFTGSGGTVSLSASASDDGGLAIAVTDTGVGMAADEISMIFEPFMQVDASLQRKHEGSGLGVPITRAIVELHGGRLSYQSEPARGTTATIVLPPERVRTRPASAAAE